MIVLANMKQIWILNKSILKNTYLKFSNVLMLKKYIYLVLQNVKHNLFNTEA